MSHKPKILIVDDDPLNVKLLAAKLPKDQYETLRAYNGQEALEKIAADCPDIVLLDIMMPGLDGYEVCGKLKSNPETKDIPVIIFTASAAVGPEELEKRRMSVGTQGIIMKPFETYELLNMVNGILKKEQ